MIILFDLDGTLIDSTEAILESFHHSFAIHKYPKQSDEEIKSLIGYPLDIMYENLGVDKELIWDFVATYKEHYREISTQKTELLKNAKEAVLLAKEFAILGIVTTKTGRYSRVLMEHFGLMEHFDVLIGREDVQNPKPHEEPILKALEKLNTKNREIWMIGDTKLDLISAKNANVNSIAVLSGYDDLDTLKKFTDVILNDALEATLYLQNRKKQHTSLSS
ncbi:MAG: hydrolase [Sulfurimonas sp. RIFCSPHIGHO2_12_FULL_36_9]|uniref:HAD family hydrolase n=1 Tax=Sulfurimonas sp. RIFCSPLOWO2_12_36_12 TaxID=1802253 RepID=UPI0008C3CBB6|nr:HAD family hydrolase [Sulfurimonas sp. RIFCSPLOWO2_12_36_12]OHD96325.1 MAG: hydrolase [Sulfurimonas sp. RIFCSPHIGHO2_12_FULL_36_9]OHD97081.1 MAG: hydrolase [Sulfurimonas sp. RIFCSPLOWO2_02_FULL_36_28]OHE00251.1 MAG: hydrolase [Sulfurimonas sp. RIFCSPLOWO2_12_36_12]OHE07972.1 MAG: hydrolase [Sulfurimonas sp. RIFCSPLOWO2_12_FULL_36_74]